MVRIYDDEGVQASELIGCAQVRLCELEPGKVKDVWLKLVKDLEIQRDNKNRGEVRSAINTSDKILITYKFCDFVFVDADEYTLLLILCI